MFRYGDSQSFSSALIGNRIPIENNVILLRTGFWLDFPGFAFPCKQNLNSKDSNRENILEITNRRKSIREIAITQHIPIRTYRETDLLEIK